MSRYQNRYDEIMTRALGFKVFSKVDREPHRGDCIRFVIQGWIIDIRHNIS